MRSDPHRPTTSQRLALPADALVLTVIAGAALVITKDMIAIPHPWLDSMDAFHITMALASIAGAGGAWFIHRWQSGWRGLVAITLALVLAVAVVLLAENAILSAADASPATATTLLTLCQALGAAAVVGMLIASAVDFAHMTDTRRRAFAIARLAGLAAVAALIVFRFIPETQADAMSAHAYAVLGLTTVTGAMGAVLGDVFLALRNRRSTANASAAGPVPEKTDATRVHRMEQVGGPDPSPSA